MNKRLKARWIKALRSGKYKQTTGTMKDAAGYCCLGVLRELIAPGSRAEDCNASALGPRHCKIAGLPRYSTDVRSESPQNKVAKMNDDGRSFTEIADYIEANF